MNTNLNRNLNKYLDKHLNKDFIRITRKHNDNNKFLYSRTQSPYKKQRIQQLLTIQNEQHLQKTTKTTKSDILEHKTRIKNNENNKFLDFRTQNPYKKQRNQRHLIF